MKVAPSWYTTRVCRTLSASHLSRPGAGYRRSVLNVVIVMILPHFILIYMMDKELYKEFGARGM